MKSALLSLIIFFGIAVLLMSVNLKAQERVKYLSYEASYVGDFAANFSGGIKKGTNYLGTANIKLSFDTEAAGLWKGGTLFINGANTHGGEPTANLSGDFQGISNIEAGNNTYLYELWYRQDAENFGVIVGLQDLASEFVFTEHGSLFLNGSFGVHSIIADNVPSAIFPLTALGAQIHWMPLNGLLLKAGVFDGMPDDFSKNKYNISWELSSGNGIFSIYEVNLNTEIFNALPGVLKAGAYFHNSELTEYSNNGFYLTADQFVKEEKASVFLQAAVSPKNKNNNYIYLGGGMTYYGLFDSRPEDVFGFGAAYAGFASGYSRGETALEITYKVQLDENIFIQPDLQYIINPSGTEEKLPDAFSGILRFGFNF